MSIKSGKWVFWWDEGYAEELQKAWDDLILILETMEEKQVLYSFLNNCIV